MAGLPGKSGPPGNQNAFRHGLAAIDNRRSEGALTENERDIRTEILSGLIADTGGEALFHRNGNPIKSFRRSWITACIKAGLGTEIRAANGKLIKKIGSRIPHDFRRTAVRNLERAGVSRSDAMKMVGHKTESIYRRYAIADERSMTESATKLDRFYAIDQQQIETTK